MLNADNPSYISKREDDGTWSIIDPNTGRVADIGGCVLRRLDADMAAGLVEDLNNAHSLRRDPTGQS
jgi:hypothetical protein